MFDSLLQIASIEIQYKQRNLRTGSGKRGIKVPFWRISQVTQDTFGLQIQLFPFSKIGNLLKGCLLLLSLLHKDRHPCADIILGAILKGCQPNFQDCWPLPFSSASNPHNLPFFGQNLVAPLCWHHLCMGPLLCSMTLRASYTSPYSFPPYSC